MKLIKSLTFSFLILAFFSIVGVAHAGFNENIGGGDCVPAFGIAVTGNVLANGCSSYQIQQYGTAGQSYDVRLYYRNTSNIDATGVKAGITVNSTGNFSGFLTSNVGGVNGTANLTIPSNTHLEFNGAQVYQRMGSSTPNMIKQITTLSELSNFSMNTIPSYAKCPSGTTFCYQGIIVATFTVKQDAAQPQLCTDTTANNYGKVLPCTYNQVLPICTDINAKNFGQQLPCVYQQAQQICTDPNAKNFGQVLPCVYQQYTPQTCTDRSAKNYGRILPCVYEPVNPYCYDSNALNRYSPGPCVYAPYNPPVVIQPQQQCVINYFTANPTQINQGGSSTLTWATTGCTSAQIYPVLNNVNVTGSQMVSPQISTTYTLYASGPNNTNATTIVSVGPAPARPVCSDGIDNDADGKVDANDPGCYVGNVYDANRASEYNVPTVVNQTVSVSTLSATSITSGTCKFNGIVSIPVVSQTNGYFKYGTSTGNLSYTSGQDNVGSNVGQYQFSDVVTGLTPNTTYYYKMVATNQYGTKEGEVRSCRTKNNTVVINEPSAPITRTVVRQTQVTPIVTTVVPDQRIIANSAPSLLFLRIDDRREDLTCSDVVDYQVVYKNVSNLVLVNAILEVQLPAGLNYVKSSAGGTYSETTNTVTFNIGQVVPGQEDAKFIQADVNCLQVDSDMLVANANMVYTNPQTLAQEEAVAYDLDRFFNSALEKNNNNLTGAAIFGIGFLPNSLLGWLIMILIILALVYLIRLFLVPNRTNTRKQTVHTETRTEDHSEI